MKFYPGDPKEYADRSKYTPTPAQIKAECAAIQQTWDEREEMHRRVTRLQDHDFGREVRMGE